MSLAHSYRRPSVLQFVQHFCVPRRYVGKLRIASDIVGEAPRARALCGPRQGPERRRRPSPRRCTKAPVGCRHRADTTIPLVIAISARSTPSSAASSSGSVTWTTSVQPQAMSRSSSSPARFPARRSPRGAPGAPCATFRPAPRPSTRLATTWKLLQMHRVRIAPGLRSIQASSVVKGSIGASHFMTSIVED